LFEGEDVGPQVAKTESDQHFAFGLDGLFATADQMLCFSPRNTHVETAVFGLVARTIERCDIAGEKGITFLGLHFANAIEVSKTDDVQIEVRLIVLISHGESPTEKNAETHRPWRGRCKPRLV